MGIGSWDVTPSTSNAITTDVTYTYTYLKDDQVSKTDVLGISLNLTTLELEEGTTEDLTETLSPADATDKNVIWNSDNETVATVDSTGKVTAVKAGTATITVTATNGTDDTEDDKTATCSVIVTAAELPKVDVDGVTLNKTELQLTEGEYLALVATVTPKDATNKSISWSSDNEDVATVDDDGKITAVSAGTATITVTTEDGEFTANCEVTVVEETSETVSVESVSLNKTELELTVDESETLKATVTPEDATNKTAFWSSDDEKVATVDEDGKITAVAVGSATITVKTEDGEKTATCVVTVKETLSEDDRAKAEIENFVERMYKICLGRESDPAGKESWVNSLINGTIDGAGIAQGFVFSQEMTDKNLSDEDFVKTLYRCMLDREADPEGLSSWVSQLKNNSLSRLAVTAGFVASDEFMGICTKYGIARGEIVVTDDPGDQPSSENSVEDFVERMYNVCLGRPSDAEGKAGWTSGLKSGAMDGAAIAKNFVFSQEMIDKNLSDEAFVTTLYNCMMGREPDVSGLKGWLEHLQSGNLSRSEVTAAFVSSPEFSGICAKYGIPCGTYDASIAPIEKFVTRFYKLCLERDPDQGGLYNWVNQLSSRAMNGAQIAEQFFFSKETLSRNLSDEKYVELLYNTMMNRASDIGGKESWLSNMENGMTRRDVLNGFICSPEFTGICETYGIERGSL